jgi:plastocyanin
MNTFFPSSMTIKVGDTVVFTTPEYEPHNVFFYNSTSGVPPEFFVPSSNAGEGVMVNPLLLSPPPQPNPYMGGVIFSTVLIQGSSLFPSSWNVTFGKAGTYTYTCLVHYPYMLGSITVVDARSKKNKHGKKPMTPAQVNASLYEQLAASQKIAVKAFFQFNDEAAAVQPIRNADGTYTNTFTVGASVTETVGSVMHHIIDFVYFFPYAYMQAQMNDTIRFVLGSTNVKPHTITTLGTQSFSALFVMAPQPSGPAHVLLNPVITTPVRFGLPVSNRTTFSNSGLLSPGGLTSYEFKLNNLSPGPLSVVCLLHGASRLVSTIYVNATKY